MADFDKFNPINMGIEMMKSFAKTGQAINKEALMASHKKNLEALTEANKTAVEVMKSISQLQTQYLKQAFEDMTAMFRETATSKADPKASWESHSEKMKHHISSAVEHGSAIASELLNSQKKMQEIFHKRMSEGLNEARELHQHHKGTKH